MRIKTVNTLIREYYRNNPNGHFFNKDTLRFFGERISDMRLFKKTVNVQTYNGQILECYKLSTFQRNHPLGARRAYYYFDIDTVDYVDNEGEL